MIPLCVIGGAMLEVIGLNPQEFDYSSDANWPGQAVFGSTEFYQPTGMGERVLTVALAARPHVMGGLDQYQVLKAHHEAQDVVLFMRLVGGIVGEVMGEVAVRHLGHREEKLAPDGVGRRHQFEAELLFVDRHAGGF